MNKKVTDYWIKFFVEKANYLANNVGAGELWSKTKFCNEIIEVLTDVADEVQKDVLKNNYSEEEVLIELNKLMNMPQSELDLFEDEDGKITKKWFKNNDKSK